MVNIKTLFSGSMRGVLLASAVLAAPAAMAQTTITLPLFGTVNAVIDWGAEGANAGCTRAVTTAGEVSCTYPAGDGPGPFQVRVSGTVTQFGNGDAGYANADRITKVVRFGSTGLQSLSGAFKGAERLTDVPADFPETVTDLSYAFGGAVLLNDPDIGNWGMRTRNVTNLTGAFEDAVQFEQTLDGWCMRQVSAPPARLRQMTKTSTQIGEIETKLRNGNGFGFGGFGSVSLPRSMRMTAEKEPRWGQCGVTLDATPPAAARSGQPYSLDLRGRASLWQNAPTGASTSGLTFTLVSGTLPPGMTLDGSTGLISGTPTTAGTYPFSIRAVQN